MSQAIQRTMAVREITYCSLFTALIAIGAYIKVPVPLVPFTLQFLFTNMAGLLLGKKLGGLSVAVYVAAGLAGLPVFAGGGGPAYILQPTFGYLIGFVFGSMAAGAIREKSESVSFRRLVFAGFVNIFIVYFFGMVWYYAVSNFYLNSSVGVKALFIYCFALAVPGDIALCFTGAYLAKRLLPVLRRSF